MGFEKVAKYIVVPGVHQPIAMHECAVNKNTTCHRKDCNIYREGGLPA
jgi:TRAP-type mannitol/chloroaromatic compound transport system substrate-binding protein